MNYRKKKQLGVTLLEILVGVAIFSTSLSLAAGVFSNSMKYRKKSEVTRQVDQDVREIVSKISYDVRNSYGQIGSFGARVNIRIYTGIKKVKIRISPNEIHEYRYIPDDIGQIVLKTEVKDNNGNWSHTTQVLSSDKIDIEALNFTGQTASQRHNERYPFLNIEIKANYVDPKDRAELESEKIHIDTAVAPRNFEFIN